MCDFVAMAQMVVGAVQAIDANGRAQDAYGRTIQTTKKALNEVYVENVRQQYGVNEEARSEKSDRIKQAEQELGSVRLAVSDLSATANSGAAFTRAIGFAEGEDVSRLEINREENVHQITQDSKAERQAATDVLQQAYQKAADAHRAMVFGVLGAAAGGGAAIGGHYVAQASARNTGASRPATRSTGR